MTEYIVKHWRGQFPLAQSCWTNGALVLLPFIAWFELVGGYLGAHPPTRMPIFVLSLVLPFVLLLPVVTWSGAGIWNSAGRRTDFARPLARTGVVIGGAVLSAAALLIARTTQNLASAPMPVAAAYEVSLRGNTAVFRGEIDKASALELELLLRDKTVKRLAIAGSSGGEEGAALKLASLINARKLVVVALAECDGVCTLLLAAGRVRAVAPDTILGFGNVPYSPDATMIYRNAGLSEAFLGAVRPLRADALFEPTLRALITNGFINEVFVTAQRRYERAPLWCGRNLALCGRSGRRNIDKARDIAR